MLTGRPATMKKKASVKPRKKEAAAVTKKTGRGTKAAVPASSPSPPEEVVAEWGMARGEQGREAPAASSAGQVAPVTGQSPDEDPAGQKAGPASAAEQQRQSPL